MIRIGTFGVLVLLVVGGGIVLVSSWRSGGGRWPQLVVESRLNRRVGSLGLGTKQFSFVVVVIVVTGRKPHRLM